MLRLSRTVPSILYFQSSTMLKLWQVSSCLFLKCPLHNYLNYTKKLPKSIQSYILRLVWIFGQAWYATAWPDRKRHKTWVCSKVLPYKAVGRPLSAGWPLPWLTWPLPYTSLATFIHFGYDIDHQTKGSSPWKTGNLEELYPSIYIQLVMCNLCNLDCWFSRKSQRKLHVR